MRNIYFRIVIVIHWGAGKKFDFPSKVIYNANKSLAHTTHRFTLKDPVAFSYTLAKDFFYLYTFQQIILNPNI